MYANQKNGFLVKIEAFLDVLIHFETL